MQKDKNLEPAVDAETAGWLVLRVCSACFLVEPRTISPEVTLPRESWSLSYH